MTDWLSAVFHDEEAENNERAHARALTAAKARVDRRYVTYLSKAKTAAEAEDRLGFIDPAVRQTVDEACQEHGCTDAPEVYAAAIEHLREAGGHKDGCDCGFCKNKGKLPGMKNDDGDSDDEPESKDEESKDDETEDEVAKESKTAAEPHTHGDKAEKRVKPGDAIGSGDASAVVDFWGMPSADITDDLKSIRHPVEEQDVTKRDGPEGLKNDNKGLDGLKSPSEQVDAQDPIGPELVGAGGTFDSSPRAADPVTSKWHLYED